MGLFTFLRLIATVIHRLRLGSDRSHCQFFVHLAPVLITAQDKGLPVGAGKLLEPYRSTIKTYARALAKGREAMPGSKRVFRTLPLGCRFGKLHFSPLLALGMLAKAPELDGIVFEILPASKAAIQRHLLGRIGLASQGGEPAQFRTVLGFRLADYAEYLANIRSTDPVLFTMLLANEFRYACEWIGTKSGEDYEWVRRGAALAELERLVEIISYLKSKHLKLYDLREALKNLAKGSASRQHQANLRAHRALLPFLEQLSYSVEGLRALFLGDRGGPPLAELISWSAVTTEMKHKAAARAAWFADKQQVRRGFRVLANNRLVRGRRHVAFTYYGIPLDHLLTVGLKDLATALERPAGVHACDHLAVSIHQGLFGSAKQCLDHQTRRAATYAEAYLRAKGHGGASNRFDPDCWFETKKDEALYGRLWALFVAEPTKRSDKSVRYQVRSCIAVLKQLLLPLSSGRIANDTVEAQRVLAQLTCGLTPISMDPIFGALLERGLVERKHLKLLQSASANPAYDSLASKQTPRVLQRLFREGYARFLGVDRRPNFPEEPSTESMEGELAKPTRPPQPATSTRR